MNKETAKKKGNMMTRLNELKDDAAAWAWNNTYLYERVRAVYLGALIIGVLSGLFLAHEANSLSLVLVVLGSGFSLADAYIRLTAYIEARHSSSSIVGLAKAYDEKKAAHHTAEPKTA